MADLRVFGCGPDYVVARDVEDARQALYEHRGGDLDDYDDEFTAVADDKPISIYVDEQDCISDDGNVLTLTAREWAQREGRGFLCSSEY